MSRYIDYKKVQEVLREKGVSDRAKTVFYGLLPYANEAGELRDDEGIIFGNVVLSQFLEVDLEVFRFYAKELENAGLLRDYDNAWGEWGGYDRIIGFEDFLMDIPEGNFYFSDLLWPDVVSESLTGTALYLYSGLLLGSEAGYVVENGIIITDEIIKKKLMLNDLELKLAVTELGALGWVKRIDGVYYCPRYFDHMKPVENDDSEVKNG